MSLYHFQSWHMAITESLHSEPHSGAQMSCGCHMVTQTTCSPSPMFQISYVTFEALYDYIGYMVA
jgi:hypothetical protein